MDRNDPWEPKELAQQRHGTGGSITVDTGIQGLLVAEPERGGAFHRTSVPKSGGCLGAEVCGDHQRGSRLSLES